MKFTNNYNLPSCFIEAIQKNTYDVDKSDPNVISVTSLISSPKIRQLTLRHWSEIEEDVSDRVWILLGSAVHSVMERLEHKNRLVEERISLPILGKILTGKSDLYDEDGVITDYKITSVWTAIYNPDGKKEWEQQLNCYAYLFQKLGFPVTKLRIVMIFRDWSATELKRMGNYPQIAVKTIDVPLWQQPTQELFIKNQVELHSDAEKVVNEDSICECSPENRWQTQDKWVVYKNSNKTATKVFDSETEANLFMTAVSNDKNTTYRLEHRPGVNRRCIDYCPCNKFCHFYKSLTPIVCGEGVVK